MAIRPISDFRGPPTVSTLPTSPIDGQEVYYQNATLAGMGRRWHLSYNASSAHASKWEYVGGRPWISAVQGTIAITPLSTYNAITGQQFTVPVNGVYEMEYGSGILNGNNASMSMVVAWWAGGVQTSARMSTVNTAGMNDYTMVSSFSPDATVAAGAVMEMRMFSASSASIYLPWMRVYPVRMG